MKFWRDSPILLFIDTKQQQEPTVKQQSSGSQKLEVFIHRVCNRQNMPPPKDAKIWNEDLLQALRAREDMALREGKQIQLTWQKGAQAIEAVRKDIYTVCTLCIVHV